eukprot:scaffold4829_cov129-Cylindrotheca_fusiformis.AAC.26
MFGWINDCTECLIVSKFGEETWHKVKVKANCNISDGGFLRYKYYHDSETVTLVVAAADVLGITVDEVLYAFGEYFLDYVRDNGYSNVLECLGSNMRDWLSNLNSLHDHLQASYPEGFVAPVFWSEDDKDAEGAIIVHYHSRRGSLLVPLVVGLIKKVGLDYFDIEIAMDQLQLQDEKEGVRNTTWRVTTVDPTMVHKLRGRKMRKPREGMEEDVQTYTTAEISNYQATFREGGTQASNLRVEEFVKRSFYNEDSELFHALTVEHYLYLIDYWKTTKIHDKWCYEIWSIQDDDPKSWAALKDLPARLNPDTFDPVHFGGKAPATGAFPPDENGILQSFPPKLLVTNASTGLSRDLIVSVTPNVTLKDAVYRNPEVEEAKIAEFPADIEDEIKSGESEIHCVVWNQNSQEAYHTFSLGDLDTTSTKQLYDLVSRTFDPIMINIQPAKVTVVDDDEEDI